MTTVNPEIAANLGLFTRPDLPTHVVSIIEEIGTRIVSPDIPEPLKRTAMAVARNVNDRRVSAEIIRDASDTLTHLRTALGEVSLASPSQDNSTDAGRLQELEVTWKHCRVRGDEDSMLLIESILGRRPQL